MKILALDSSGLVASIALVEDGRLIAEYTINYKKTHSQTLLPMLDEIRGMVELDLNSIDAIATSSGPGSFTGLRIGAATAKGLGLALKKPLVEVPTLEGLAYNLWGTNRLVCPLMDARRNQVYTGVYEFVAKEQDFVLNKVIEQCAADVNDIIDRVNTLGREVIFLGDGVGVYRETLIQRMKVPFSFAPANNNCQRAASVAALGAVYYAQGKTVDPAKHQPEYLRKSQAEREREEAAGKAGLIIRQLQEEDIEALSRIEAASFSMPWSAQDFADLLKRDYCIYLVAELDGEVAGCCGMTNICNEGNIDNVVVAERFRGRGIAGKLLRELIARADALGVKAYTLEVRTSNSVAIHLYEKLGFVSEGIRPNFYEKPVEDAMIMWRRKSSL